ncbi:glycosyltransferase [Methylosinus sp. Sm6]|uniref:glycosyltransferase n=1 Tax=Methylosinus sp. Sm6 TaxID=2866948 RepID=UPI001C990D80|nr:glycosyltransferase [Methylosinus sp. Sm6]MBY6243415.1 glycosyltransferase [Methylosinus sp. Sm6]
MKVLHIIASVDPRHGGPIAGVTSSAEVWSRHGHVRHILSLDAADAPHIADCPVLVFPIGFKGRLYAFARRALPWLRYGYSPHLTSWLKAHVHEYDAVIINGLWNYASLGGWRGLRGLDVPYFVFTHGALDPWFNHAYPMKTIFKSIFWRLFEHRVLRDAAGVFFTSEEERLVSRTSFAPYRAKEIVVGYGSRDIVGDGDAQRAAFLERYPATKNRRLILFLSRIHKKKGVDLLLDAFAQIAADFPDFDLVIAGPDQVGLQASLEARADRLAIGDRVLWSGMLSGDLKWGAYRAADFFVLPSHQENFGIVVTDAMALCVPVLITNKVNIWREIEADGAGIVVDDEANSIAQGLRRLCAISAEDRAAIGRKARASFLARFDLEANAIDLLEQIRRSIGNADASVSEVARAHEQHVPAQDSVRIAT